MTRLASNPDVLVFGEINPDIVVTAVPDLSFGQREDVTGPTTMSVGSSVAITACGLARLGTSSGVVGVIGDDAFGAFMMQRLRDRNVLVNRVRKVPGGRTGSSVILVRREDSSDRQILTDPGIMGDLRTRDLDLDGAQGVRHLHVGSWFLHTGAVADLPMLLADARRRGLSTSVDPNDDPARTWDSHLPEALEHVDVFFCNESEARGVAKALGTYNGGPVHDAAEQILAHLAPGAVVILKCGRRGAFAHSAGTTLHVDAPAIAVRDTVGAGDTLAAAFLHARLQGADTVSALRLAVAAGSLSTRRSGGVEGQPTIEEADRLAGTLTVTAATTSRSRRSAPAEKPVPENEDAPVTNASVPDAPGRVTAEEIASQPELWRRAQQQADDGIAGLPRPGERVLVLGCGTSYYVAAAYAALREQGGQGVTDAVIASELGDIVRPYDRVVAISRSGTTTEVVEALTRIAPHVPVTAVLGELGTPVGAGAAHIIDLSYADERSVVQTRFPTTLLALLRASLGQSAASRAAMVAAGQAALSAPVDARTPRQLVVLGTGWAAHLAQEAALKCRESAGMWAEAYASGEFRHGPISVAGPGTLVWAMTPLTPLQIESIERTGASIHRGGDEPLAELVKLQRHAVAWAAAAGRDADRPAHLSRSVVAL